MTQPTKVPRKSQTPSLDLIRSFGFISSNASACLYPNGNAFFVSVPSAAGFTVFDAESLNVIIHCDHLEREVLSLASHGETCFVASRHLIHRYERDMLVADIKVANETILSMQIHGNYLIALSKRKLFAFDISKADNSRLCCIEFAKEKSATSFCHPHGYQNKFIVGFDDGSIELWNISSEKLIHTFASKHSSSVNKIVASNVEHVIALGCDDGTILILNALSDETLFTLKQTSAVSSLSFGSSAEPILLSGSVEGEIFCWNLESRAILQKWNAHSGKIVSGISSFPGQPMFISNGGDNSLKIHVMENGQFRVLKSREGSVAPISCLKFYGNDGRHILTGSNDGSLRMASLIRDSQSYSFSKSSEKNVELSAPIEGISFCSNRDLKWADVITNHRGMATCFFWRKSLKAIDSVKVKSQSNSPLSASAVSSCGNFCALGTQSGEVSIFNLQSGRLVKSIQVSEAVFSVHFDLSNTFLLVVLSGGKLKSFSFGDYKLTCEYDLIVSVQASKLCARNNIICIAAEKEVILFDVLGNSPVRRFSSPNSVSLVDISSDGLSLAVIQGLTELSLFDIPTGSCISHASFSSPVTAMEISPLLDSMAIVNEGQVGFRLFKLPGAKLTLGELRVQYSAQGSVSNLSQLVRLTEYVESKALSRPIELEAPTADPFFLDALALKQPPKDEQSEAKPMVSQPIPSSLDLSELEKILDSPSVPEMVGFIQSILTREELDGFLGIIIKLASSNADMLAAVMSVVLSERFDLIRDNLSALRPQLEAIRNCLATNWEEDLALIQSVSALESMAKSSNSY